MGAVLIGTTAFGQTQPEAERIAPRLLEAPPVTYPADGSGGAVVILSLDIDATGRVTKVQVINGNEPFASVAAHGARQFRFAPARQGGRARASRIAYRLRFSEPPPELSADKSAPEDTPEIAMEAGIEVDVRGPPRPVGATSLSAADIEALPGAFGDGFRAVESLPGITPIASGVPYFFVRGSPPGNVGYFLDGIEVPLVFHVGLGPSVIHPWLIDSVTFHPGAYPAQFGRFAGGIVSADMRPVSPVLRGQATLRLFDAGALLEAPFPDQRGSALIAGRYSYTSALLSAFSPEIDLGYWDYQARVAYRLDADQTVSVFSFGSADLFAEGGELETETVYDGQFHRLDLRYDRELSDGRMRIALLLGYDETLGEGARALEDKKLGVRMSIEQAAGAIRWRAGGDATFDRFDTSTNPDPCTTLNCPPEVIGALETSTEYQIDQSFRQLFPSRTDFEAGLWTDAVVQVGPRVSITPGVRVDFYTSQGKSAVAVDPRLSLRAEPVADVWLVPAVGLAHQLPGFLPGPGFQIAGIQGGLQRGLHSSFGVETTRVTDWDLRATVFRNVIFDLNDPLGATRGTGLKPERFLTKTTGDTIGLELLVRRSLTERVATTTSYTLSRSTRSVDGRELPSSLDRTHVLSSAVLFDLGNRWRAGVRQTFYTGFPQDESNVYRDRDPDPPRTLPFYRLDLNAQKRWPIGKTGYWGLLFEVQNALARSETADVQCDEERCEPVVIGPVVIPSVGLEAGF